MVGEHLFLRVVCHLESVGERKAIVAVDAGLERVLGAGIEGMKGMQGIHDFPLFVGL